MSNESIKKLLVNVQQNFTDAEKRQGRNNLDAAAAGDVITDAVRYSEQSLTVAEQTQSRENIGAISSSEVNTAIQEAVNSLAAVARTGNYDDLINKPSIPAAQVQSDWNQADNTRPDFIKNKPEILLFKVTLNTTLAELDTAVSAGKVPFLVASSRVIPMCRYTSGASAWFSDVTQWGNLLTVGVHTYCLNNNGWSEYPSSVNGNTNLHLPSCITSRVNVVVKDAIDTWLTIGEISIGGHGIQGGGIAIMIKAVSDDLRRAYLYDTLFRTTATTSGAGDNECTYGSITAIASSWTNLLIINQYSGTSTVDCKLEVNLYDTSNANPSHYHINFRKTYDGTNTKMYVSATEAWGRLN